MQTRGRSLINNIVSGIGPHATNVTILQTTFQAAPGKSSSAAFCSRLNWTLIRQQTLGPLIVARERSVAK